MYRNDGDLASRQYLFSDGQCRWRHDVAVGLDVGKLAQKCIGNRQTGGPAGVVRSHEHDTGTLVVGEIIGKRADCLCDPGRGVSAQRLLALHQIGLDVLQHGLQLGIGIAARRAHGCD